MKISPAQLRKILEQVARIVIEHEAELTALDQAIGDGDHGINMKRGFEAVLKDVESLSSKPLPEALKASGMVLVMKVGGASGPLFGTLFMSFGKALPADTFTRGALSDALSQAVNAVKARGKSEPGQKTMLDVLVPVCEALVAGEATDRLPMVAAEAADATVPMQAVKGRASFLGERSIGHMDPGARSSALMVTAVCNALGERGT